MTLRIFQDRLDSNNGAYDANPPNAYQTGGAELETQLVNSLAEQAREGNTVAAMFLLTSKGKFVDRHTAPAQASNRPTVNIVLPAPATAEELAKLTQQMTHPMLDVTPVDEPAPTRKELVR